MWLSGASGCGRRSYRSVLKCHAVVGLICYDIVGSTAPVPQPQEPTKQFEVHCDLHGFDDLVPSHKTAIDEQDRSTLQLSTARKVLQDSLA